MPALAQLHSRLNQLRHRRQLVRLGLAGGALVAGVLITLAVAFFIDWALEMSRPQRFVSLVLCLGVITWVFRKHALPWLFVRETDVDLALIVERNQHIDSDLVAALQFSSPEAKTWGSTQLETAVIDYVDDFSTHLNVLEGFSYRRLKRRLWTGGTVLVIALLWTAIFPRHVGAFLNRLLLGSAHYPTKTQIARIRMNDAITLTREPGEEAVREPVKAPHGEPLAVEILARGVIPADGLVRLTSKTSGTHVEVPLTKAGTPNDKEATFRGELPHLVDSVSYQVYLGDAWTDPLEIHDIPLPVVTVELTPHPPAYAAVRAAESEAHAGSRQIAVIEGSTVDLKVICGNKALTSATLTVPEVMMGDSKSSPTWPLAAVDKEKSVWTLQGDDSPFRDIRQPLRYEVQVKDVDGMSLDRPLLGYIRLKTDRIPRVAAAIVSRRVVPAATPKIVYGAADDFGIARITAKLQVQRKDGTTQDSVRQVLTSGDKTPQTVVRGEYALDLSSLNLEKGDELKITLEAFDYRGDKEPKSSVSEPLVLQVTDREGILAGLQEADEKSAKQLDAIIQRELGIGESK